MATLKATLLSLLLGSTTGSLIPQRQVEAAWPSSYVAMGDSFAAGIGAGNFYDDPGAKKCKRFTGSYPSLVKTGITSLISIDFVTCSGDKLQHLDAQHAQVKVKRADIVTLSISGNDFGFGKAVEKCIYNYGGPLSSSDDTKDKECKAALDASEDLVDGNEVWEKYEKAVQKILSDRLTENPKSFLIITGYAKFFADDNGDFCGDKRLAVTGIPYKTNLVRKNTRNRMNEMVTKVNHVIKSRIVGQHSEKANFVDIDELFNGHRFCEPGMGTSAIPKSSDDNANVWIISFATKLDENEYVENPDNQQQAMLASQGIDKGLFPDVTPPNKLRQNSVFHPKQQGHHQTTFAIQELVEHRTTGITCVGGRAPNNPPPKVWIPNLSAQGKAVEPREILDRMRNVLCGSKGNKCESPPDIDPKYVAAWKEEVGGKCELTIGIRGDEGQLALEAYMQRSRSLDTDDQVQHCWDTTQLLIRNCVKNDNKKGYKAGQDPNPAFYEAGFREFGGGEHRTPDVLPRPPKA